MTALVGTIAILAVLLLTDAVGDLARRWWRRRLLAELRQSGERIARARDVRVEVHAEGGWSDYRRAARLVHASHTNEEITR